MIYRCQKVNFDLNWTGLVPGISCGYQYTSEIGKQGSMCEDFSPSPGPREDKMCRIFKTSINKILGHFMKY